MTSSRFSFASSVVKISGQSLDAAFQADRLRRCDGPHQARTRR